MTGIMAWSSTGRVNPAPHSFSRNRRVGPQAVAQFSPDSTISRHFDGGGNNGRREGVGEQSTDGVLRSHSPPLYAQRNITAERATKRFAACSDDITRPITSTKYSYEPRAFSPTKPTAYGSSTITSASYYPPESHTPFRLAIRAVHENAPNRWRWAHGEHRFTRLFQACFQFNHIVVGIAETLRFTQAHTINDGSVVKGVGEANGIFCTQQRLKQTPLVSKQEEYIRIASSCLREVRQLFSQAA